MSEFESLAQLTVVAMVPYLLASLGTMLGGLTGVFSVAQEGVMVLGASVGFLVSYGVGSNTVGILAAAAVGAVFGLLLGAATTFLRLDQFVVGLALFFAATGLAGLLFRVVIGQSATEPLVPTIPRLEIPFLSDIPLIGPRCSRRTRWSTSPPWSRWASTSTSTAPGRAWTCARWARTPRPRDSLQFWWSARGCGRRPPGER